MKYLQKACFPRNCFTKNPYERISAATGQNPAGVTLHMNYKVGYIPLLELCNQINPVKWDGKLSPGYS